ncbi:MAG: hypothetical protein WCK47_08875 [bacterium]|nr:hypothetical protein [Candidatus Sumerlaeota bacterium]
MKNPVLGIVLIVVAIALIYFYAWPKLKPYISPDMPSPPGAGGPGMMMPGMPLGPGGTTATQPMRF